MYANRERAARSPGPARAAAARAGVADPRALLGAIGNRAVARAVRMRGNPVTAGVSCFAQAGMHSDRFADDVNARIVYDDETRRWNENEGRDRGDWGEALFDAWGYCFIAACHQRQSSGTAALGTAYDVIATAGHELWQATAGWFSPSGDRDTTTQDAFNRDVGIAIARDHPDGDLYELCFDAMVEGRLDLSAAGVARGRALTTR
jgi:hypothetical protein